MSCAKCKYKTKEGLIGCEGACNKWFHSGCINISEAEFKLIEKNSIFFYLCDICKKSCEIIEKSKYLNIKSSLTDLQKDIAKLSHPNNENQCSSLLENLKKEMCAHFELAISKLKTELNQSFNEQLKDLSSKINPCTTSSNRYSDAVKKTNLEPPIIVKPKNSLQLNPIC